METASLTASPMAFVPVELVAFLLAGVALSSMGILTFIIAYHFFIPFRLSWAYSFGVFGSDEEYRAYAALEEHRTIIDVRIGSLQMATWSFATETPMSLVEATTTFFGNLYDYAFRIVGLTAFVFVMMVARDTNTSILEGINNGYTCHVAPFLYDFILPTLNSASLFVSGTVIQLGNFYMQMVSFFTHGTYRIFVSCATWENIKGVLEAVVAACAALMYSTGQWLKDGFLVGRIDLVPALGHLGRVADELGEPVSCFCSFLDFITQPVLTIPQVDHLHNALDRIFNAALRLVQIVFYFITTFSLPSVHPLAVEIVDGLYETGYFAEDLFLIVVSFLQGFLTFLNELLEITVDEYAVSGGALDVAYNNTHAYANATTASMRRGATLGVVLAVASMRADAERKATATGVGIAEAGWSTADAIAQETAVASLGHLMWRLRQQPTTPAAINATIFDGLLELDLSNPDLTLLLDLIGIDGILKVANGPWSQSWTGFYSAGVTAVNGTLTLIINFQEIAKGPSGLAYFQLGHIGDHLRNASDGMATIGALFDAKLPCAIARVGYVVVGMAEGLLEFLIGWIYSLFFTSFRPGAPPPAGTPYASCKPYGAGPCTVDYLAAYWDWPENRILRTLGDAEQGINCTAGALGCTHDATTGAVDCTEAPLTCIVRQLADVVLALVRVIVTSAMYTPEIVQFNSKLHTARNVTLDELYDTINGLGGCIARWLEQYDDNKAPVPKCRSATKAPWDRREPITNRSEPELNTEWRPPRFDYRCNVDGLAYYAPQEHEWLSVEQYTILTYQGTFQQMPCDVTKPVSCIISYGYSDVYPDAYFYYAGNIPTPYFLIRGSKDAPNEDTTISGVFNGNDNQTDPLYGGRIDYDGPGVADVTFSDCTVAPPSLAERTPLPEGYSCRADGAVFYNSLTVVPGTPNATVLNRLYVYTSGDVDDARNASASFNATSDIEPAVCGPFQVSAAYSCSAGNAPQIETDPGVFFPLNRYIASGYVLPADSCPDAGSPTSMPPTFLCRYNRIYHYDEEAGQYNAIVVGHFYTTYVHCDLRDAGPRPAEYECVPHADAVALGFDGYMHTVGNGSSVALPPLVGNATEHELRPLYHLHSRSVPMCNLPPLAENVSIPCIEMTATFNASAPSLANVTRLPTNITFRIYGGEPQLYYDGRPGALDCYYGISGVVDNTSALMNVSSPSSTHTDAEEDVLAAQAIADAYGASAAWSPHGRPLNTAIRGADFLHTYTLAPAALSAYARVEHMNALLGPTFAQRVAAARMRNYLQSWRGSVHREAHGKDVHRVQSSLRHHQMTLDTASVPPPLSQAAAEKEWARIARAIHAQKLRDPSDGMMRTTVEEANASYPYRKESIVCCLADLVEAVVMVVTAFAKELTTLVQEILHFFSNTDDAPNVPTFAAAVAHLHTVACTLGCTLSRAIPFGLTCGVLRDTITCGDVPSCSTSLFCDVADFLLSPLDIASEILITVRAAVGQGADADTPVLGPTCGPDDVGRCVESIIYYLVTKFIYIFTNAMRSLAAVVNCFLCSIASLGCDPSLYVLVDDLMSLVEIMATSFLAAVIKLVWGVIQFFINFFGGDAGEAFAILGKTIWEALETFVKTIFNAILQFLLTIDIVREIIRAILELFSGACQFLQDAINFFTPEESDKVSLHCDEIPDLPDKRKRGLMQAGGVGWMPARMDTDVATMWADPGTATQCRQRVRHFNYSYNAPSELNDEEQRELQYCLTLTYWVPTGEGGRLTDDARADSLLSPQDCVYLMTDLARPRFVPDGQPAGERAWSSLSTGERMQAHKCNTQRLRGETMRAKNVLYGITTPDFFYNIVPSLFRMADEAAHAYDVYTIYTNDRLYAVETVLSDEYVANVEARGYNASYLTALRAATIEQAPQFNVSAQLVALADAQHRLWSDAPEDGLTIDAYVDRMSKLSSSVTASPAGVLYANGRGVYDRARTLGWIRWFRDTPIFAPSFGAGAAAGGDDTVAARASIAAVANSTRVYRDDFVIGPSLYASGKNLTGNNTSSSTPTAKKRSFTESISHSWITMLTQLAENTQKQSLPPPRFRWSTLTGAIEPELAAAEGIDLRSETAAKHMRLHALRQAARLATDAIFVDSLTMAAQFGIFLHQKSDVIANATVYTTRMLAQGAIAGLQLAREFAFGEAVRMRNSLDQAVFGTTVLDRGDNTTASALVHPVDTHGFSKTAYQRPEGMTREESANSTHAGLVALRVGAAAAWSALGRTMDMVRYGPVFVAMSSLTQRFHVLREARARAHGEPRINVLYAYVMSEMYRSWHADALMGRLGTERQALAVAAARAAAANMTTMPTTDAAADIIASYDPYYETLVNETQYGRDADDLSWEPPRRDSERLRLARPPALTRGAPMVSTAGNVFHAALPCRSGYARLCDMCLWLDQAIGTVKDATTRIIVFYTLPATDSIATYDFVEQQYALRRDYYASADAPVRLGDSPTLPARFPALYHHQLDYVGDSTPDKQRFDDYMAFVHRAYHLFSGSTGQLDDGELFDLVDLINRRGNGTFSASTTPRYYTGSTAYRTHYTRDYLSFFDATDGNATGDADWTPPATRPVLLPPASETTLEARRVFGSLWRGLKPSVNEWASAGGGDSVRVVRVNDTIRDLVLDFGEHAYHSIFRCSFTSELDNSAKRFSIGEALLLGVVVIGGLSIVVYAVAPGNNGAILATLTTSSGLAMFGVLFLNIVYDRSINCGIAMPVLLPNDVMDFITYTLLPKSALLLGGLVRNRTYDSTTAAQCDAGFAMVECFDEVGFADFGYNLAFTLVVEWPAAYDFLVTRSRAVPILDMILQLDFVQRRLEFWRGAAELLRTDEVAFSNAYMCHYGVTMMSNFMTLVYVALLLFVFAWPFARAVVGAFYSMALIVGQAIMVGHACLEATLMVPYVVATAAVAERRERVLALDEAEADEGNDGGHAVVSDTFMAPLRVGMRLARRLFQRRPRLHQQRDRESHGLLRGSGSGKRSVSLRASPIRPSGNGTPTTKKL